MTNNAHTALAKELWEARQAGHVVDSDQHPTDVAQAYQLLEAVTAATGKNIVGYKLGATTAPALEMMQLEEPFAGPLLDGLTFSSGHTAAVFAENNPALESEFVLGLSKDIPAGGNLTESDVAAAVGWIAGGFELIGKRFAELPTGRGLCTIGDGAGNFIVVTGEPNNDPHALDLAALPVTLKVNGEVSASGLSNDSLQGSPLGMLTWFANSSVVPERGLKAGDMIYCGTCTGLTPVKSGDKVEADFGVLGTVSTTIA